MALEQAPSRVPAMTATSGDPLMVRRDTAIGCLKATGDDALDLLNRLSTNKVDHLQPGHWAPTVLTSDRGRIVDLLTLIRTDECVYLLTSPDQQLPVMDWLDKYTIMEDLVVEDVSDSTAVVALAGRNAEGFLGIDPADCDRLPGMQYPAPVVTVGDTPAIAISRPMGTIPCCLLLAAADSANHIVSSLTASGALEVDAGHWESLRIANGAPAWGAEMGEPYNPLEVGLIGAIDFTKGCYIGQEVIARLDSYDKVQRYLSLLRFSDGADPVVGAGLYQGGRQAGTVTSLYRTAAGDLRGLGFVRTISAVPGQTLDVGSPASGIATIEDTPKFFGPGQDFS